VEVATRITFGETTVTRQAKIEAPERGQGEAALDALEATRFEWGGKNFAAIETEARSGALADAERVSVPLLPWGSERRVGASGSSSSTVVKTLSLGDGAFQRRALRIDLGPPPNRLLVDMALFRQGLWAPATATVVDWLLTTRDVLSYLRRHRRGSADAARLEAQLASLAQSVVFAQNSDGGVGWAGPRSNPFVSAKALRALTLAREAGAPVPEAALKRLAGYVGEAFRNEAEDHHAEKATLLFGLVYAREKGIAAGT
jgi:hypothetical protein